MMRGKDQPTEEPGRSEPASEEVVVFDPNTVLEDALNYTPWGDEGGHLPQRGEWSTLRGASKDLILWTATFMFDQTRRRLDIKAYFVGEHPVFKELEPTRAVLTVLLCQAWQSGRSLALHFEGGVPIDVRELIERRLGKVLSGHDEMLEEEISEPLFAELSGFSASERKAIQQQVPQLAQVCSSVYRGMWSSGNVRSFLARGVPLNWIFGRSPGPITSAHQYWCLARHLRAVLLEDYVLHRLVDRRPGETLGNLIRREDRSGLWWYESAQDLQFSDPDADVSIPAQEPFRIVPLLPIATAATRDGLQEAIAACGECGAGGFPVIGLPLDLRYLPDDQWMACTNILKNAKLSWVLIGLTQAQLQTEIGQKLALTIEEYDYDTMDTINAERYTD